MCILHINIENIACCGVDIFLSLGPVESFSFQLDGRSKLGGDGGCRVYICMLCLQCRASLCLWLLDAATSVLCSLARRRRRKMLRCQETAVLPRHNRTVQELWLH